MLLCVLLTPNAASTEIEARKVHHTQALSEELDNYALSPANKTCKNFRAYLLHPKLSFFFPISLFTWIKPLLNIISSEKHTFTDTFFPNIKLRLLHSLSSVSHTTHLREWKKLKKNKNPHNSCGVRNTKKNTKLLPGKKNISWSTSPVTPLCSFLLPACLCLTAMHCALGKLQSFTQNKEQLFSLTVLYGARNWE